MLETFFADSCELRKSASKQCGIHFLRKFPQSWVWLPLTETHHQILSARWEQICLGLTQSVIIYLQWELSQELEYSKFIWPMLLSWVESQITRWFSNRGIGTREIKLTWWSSSQCALLQAPSAHSGPSSPMLARSRFCPDPWLGCHYVLIITKFVFPGNLFSELPALIHLPVWSPPGCSPSTCPKQSSPSPNLVLPLPSHLSSGRQCKRHRDTSLSFTSHSQLSSTSCWLTHKRRFQVHPLQPLPRQPHSRLLAVCFASVSSSLRWFSNFLLKKNLNPQKAKVPSAPTYPSPRYRSHRFTPVVHVHTHLETPFTGPFESKL